MQQLRIGLLAILALLPTRVLSQVDERPLSVGISLAFASLKWPDWLTGADSGKSRDPRPLLLTGVNDGTNRVFVASQYGAVLFWPNQAAVVEPGTLLDIRDRVQYSDEQNEEGFLGFALHPKFKENGEFFVYYTAKPTATHPHLSVISRFHVSKENPDHADPKSEEIILTIPQPYWNHNGGTIVFGPDGYLYIGLGDGGAANDPHGNGQNLKTLLGKILRIDVDHKNPPMNYAIPTDNPFANRNDGTRGEIWAYGIRNVWRIAFDRAKGDLWAGEVGQDLWEEIDIITRGGNYGWNLREGKHPFGPNGNPPRADLIEPIWDYPHSVGKSITGGNVYRGKAAPQLEGAYIYADYVTGQIWALAYDAKTKRVTANRTLRQKGEPILSFGDDDAGEMYFHSATGGIYKFSER